MIIPKKLLSAPIISAVVELRLQPSLDMFGDVIHLRDLFRNSGIDVSAQTDSFLVPARVLEQDESFRWNRLYGGKQNNGCRVEIGSNVVVIFAPIPYTEWSLMEDTASRVLEILQKKDPPIIIQRIGIRYVNRLPQPPEECIAWKEVFTKMNPEFTLQSVRLERVQSALSTAVIRIEREMNEQIASTILDIDVITSWSDHEINFDPLMNAINDSHNNEKLLFFSFLNSEFLQKLGPTYD